jgi:hypothetical protein
MAATETGFKPATIRHHPERFLSLTAWATARGYPLGRRMTKHERRVVAVISAHPTHTMTLTSASSTHEEMADQFRGVVKHLNRWLEKRSPQNPKRLVYVATLASARDSGRYHAHALLWTYVHAPTLHGICREVGLGRPTLRKLPDRPAGDIHYWTQVAYVLTQDEPAFGTEKHLENESRPVSARRLLYPQRATLERHCPQLLSALEDANDPTVPGETLLSRLPNFSISK